MLNGLTRERAEFPGEEGEFGRGGEDEEIFLHDGTTVAVVHSSRNTRPHACGQSCPWVYTLSSEARSYLMLVLSRKVGERIHVGDNIVLEIRRIAGNRVTLALDAPRDVRILRGELSHAVQEFRAAGPSCDALATKAANGAHVSGRVPILNSLPVQSPGRDFAI
jgi:carbon storage regulator